MQVGQRVLVDIPPIGDISEMPEAECMEGETFEAVVIGMNVPCLIAPGLIGMEVQKDDGMIYHISPEWATSI